MNPLNFPGPELLSGLPITGRSHALKKSSHTQFEISIKFSSGSRI